MESISEDPGILSVLNGKHLKISGNFFPPYVYTTLEKGKTVFAGANYEIVRSASQKLNFTFDLDAPKGKPTGLKLKNGTWTGLFADILYKKSDLAIVLAHTKDRNGLVDFTPSFGSANLVFTTAFPKTEIKPEAIAYAFSPGVWALFFLTMALCTPLVFYGGRLAHRKFGKAAGTWTESWLVVLKICLEESTAIPAGAYLPASLLLIFTIIMGTGYKCNLLSLLSFPNKETIPTTFDELGKRLNYKIYFDMSGIVGYNFFMKGESPLVVNLRERFKENLVKGNPAQCIVSSLLEPATACIGWHTVLGQVKGKNLTMVRGVESVFQNTVPIMSTWVTIGLRKDSEYSKAFSFITSSYFETGHVTKWLENIFSEFQSQGVSWMQTQRGTPLHGVVRNVLVETVGGVTKPLTVGNYKVVFTLLLFGFSVGTCQFGVEIFHKKRLEIEMGVKRVVGGGRPGKGSAMSIVSVVSKGSDVGGRVGIGDELKMPKDLYMAVYYKSPFDEVT